MLSTVLPKERATKSAKRVYAQAEVPSGIGRIGFNLRVTAETHQRMQAAAFMTNRKLQDIAETALLEYLDGMGV